eukprot:485340-Prymnesium_polylepis.3
MHTFLVTGAPVSPSINHTKNTTARRSWREQNTDLVATLLQPHLQGNYSIALYGGPGRVPLDSLKLVWLPLLGTDALRAVADAGGICLLHAKFRFPLFYAPHNPKCDPVGALWIRRDYGVSYNRPIPNHSWVEVTHCGASSGRPGPAIDSDERRTRRFSWDVGPSWYYVAQGSGVSINVGRTAVLGWHSGTQALVHLYERLWGMCGGNNTGSGYWRLREANETEVNGTAGASARHEWSAPIETVPPAQRSLRSSHGIDLLGYDSLQITGHKEYFSVERRHEIIMLHQPNCAPRGDPARPRARTEGTHSIRRILPHQKEKTAHAKGKTMPLSVTMGRRHARDRRRAQGTPG